MTLALTGCAGGSTGATTDPAAKQRANAEKQEQLQEMLEKGQRN
jgi:hypothetical protein